MTVDPLKKIKLMTSDRGIYQHGELGGPKIKFGYALEDQARALIIADELGDTNLRGIYLNFTLEARRQDGLLYHFYYENNGGGFFSNSEVNSKPNPEEAYGLTLWALLNIKTRNNNISRITRELIKEAHNWNSPRAIAAALMGLLNLSRSNALEKEMRKKLHNFYFNNSYKDWIWFESYLTYANAIIPWALWETYLRRNCKTSLEIAEKTTNFLIEKCQQDNIPAPVGNNGWYFKGREKAVYDQQPIDAAYMVCCLEKAYLSTKDDFYKRWAEKWFRWFFGYNIKGVYLVDKNFGCYDGLTPKGINSNQGAESSICFLMAFLSANRLGIGKWLY
ncbi:MAG: hypothetical protein U9O59_03320 [Actinomycetota bacterium]|nr:hypothetical protein [Actinomycetota bacterium]